MKRMRLKEIFKQSMNKPTFSEIVIPNANILLILVVLLTSVIFMQPCIIISVVLLNTFPLALLNWRNVVTWTILLFLTNITIIITIYISMTLLNVSIDVWTTAFLFVFLSLVIHLLVRRFTGQISSFYSNDVVDYLLLFIFLITLVSRVGPVVNDIAPILHDPVAHSIWIHSIFETGTISFHYSPGLHILTHFPTMLVGDLYQIPRNLGMLTNFFSSIGVLLTAFFYKRRFKSNVGGILIALGMIVIPYPAYLYFIAGKNALIAALAVFPVVILSFKTKSILHVRTIIITNMGLFLIGFLHYPTFIVTAFILFIMCVLDVDSIVKNLKQDKTKYFRFGSYLIAPISVLIWTYKFRSSFISGASSIETNSIHININSLLIAFKTVYYNLVGTATNVNVLGPLIFWSGIFSVFLILISDRPYKKFVLSLTSALILPVVIVLFQLHGLDIMIESTILMVFSVLIIPIVIIVDTNRARSKKKLLNFILSALVLLAIFYSAIIFLKYNTKESQLSVIDKYDLQAFKWIDQHVPKQSGFLIGALYNKDINVVFPTDGGMWIPVFTSNKVSADFVEKSSVRTISLYELVENIRTNKDDFVEIKNLVEYGFSYIYVDKGVYGPSIDINDFDEVKPELVFENRSVKIYEIRWLN